MQAAIFGAPPKQDGLDCGEDEDLPQVTACNLALCCLGQVARVKIAAAEGDEQCVMPQVVVIPEMDGDDAMPAVVEQPAAPSQPKLSWREKAAQLRAQREALQNVS